jgi:asparagine synthetase B (glutamine-hydrolysing)
MLEATLAHMREQPAPLLNPWTPAYINLAKRARRRGARIILSGHGGDEWLGVSPFLSADLMRRFDLPGLVRFFANYRRSCHIPTIRVLRTIFWQFGLRPVGSSLLERAVPRAWTANRARRSVQALQPWLAPDPSLRASIVARVERSIPPANPPRSFYFRDIRQMMEHPLVAMELEEMFEMGRRLGFRYANPYWDGDVVDILYRTPPDVLLAGGRSKGVVRATMAKRFPGLGLDRQRKRGSTTFFTSIVASQVPDLWRRNHELPGLAGLGIVDADGAGRMAARALERRDLHDLVRVWYLMNTEAWVAAHA